MTPSDTPHFPPPDGSQQPSWGPPLDTLRAAARKIATTDSAAPSDALRSEVLRAVDAAEAVLRRILRDDPQAPLELRLRALAADELPPDDLVAELRQRDRISIELAAGFHELLALRRRLLGGGDPTPRDAELTARVAERLEGEVRTMESMSPNVAELEPPPRSAELLQEAAASDDPAGIHPVPLPARGRGKIPPWLAVTVLLALALALLLGFWWGADRDGEGIEEGVALFRTGNTDAAAEHFRRFAAEHPDDPTPRLYLARLARREGRYAAAQQELREALRLAPEDAGLHSELGYLLLDTERPEAATERFRTAIVLDSTVVEGWIGLVRALRDSDQRSAAERVLARAPAPVRARLERSPSSPR